MRTHTAAVKGRRGTVGRSVSGGENLLTLLIYSEEACTDKVGEFVLSLLPQVSDRYCKYRQAVTTVTDNCDFSDRNTNHGNLCDLEDTSIRLTDTLRSPLKRFSIPKVKWTSYTGYRTCLSDLPHFDIDVEKPWGKLHSFAHYSLMMYSVFYPCMKWPIWLLL